MKISKILVVLIAAIFLMGMTACGQSGSSGSSGSADNSGSAEQTEAAAELPMSISQDEWDSNRQYVDLSTGIKMAYVEMGDPEGDPLILIHGMTDNSRSWSLVFSYFAEAGYHVYMPDLRGHGYTDKPKTGMYTINDHAADVSAFMEAKGIEKADLVGHSMGSMTLQDFMFSFPEKCDDVVLEASTPLTSDDMNLGIYESVKDLKDGEHPDDAFMDGWYTNPNPVDEEFLEHEKSESQNIDAYAWKAIAAGGSAIDLTHYYPVIDANDIDCLILHGTADGFFNDESQEKLQKLLPDAEYKAYDGIGHNIQWEIPEQFAKDVIKFIQ